MGIEKHKNQLNIYKEFWNLTNQANDLANTGNYDVDMLISAWKHQLTASNFFYGTLVGKELNHDANKTYYSLKTEPKEHQFPHWCYVLKHCGTKLIVVPVTSIKQDSGTLTVPYEYDIEEDNHIKARMHFDDIRCVDKMRILEKKGYINIITSRIEIEKAISDFFNFTGKTIDAKE